MTFVIKKDLRQPLINSKTHQKEWIHLTARETSIIAPFSDDRTCSLPPFYRGLATSWLHWVPAGYIPHLLKQTHQADHNLAGGALLSRDYLVISLELR